MNTYKSTEYTLYEDEVPVFTGDCREVAEKYGISTSAVSSYRNNGTKLFGKYLILKTGEPQRKKKPQTSKKSKEEQTLEYLSNHLRFDGNVSFSNKDEIKRIDVYLDKLKDMGLECNARKVYDSDPTIPNPWRKKKSYYYILERTNAERTSQSI
ncbi:MAG: hypothetical protein IKG65_08035 [Exiguobacterium sp.]|nr:hypothetical protein [Exiguobacterium sp.]